MKAFMASPAPVTPPCFPQAIGMAATWDRPRSIRSPTPSPPKPAPNTTRRNAKKIHSIYYGLTFWSPNINIFRDPRWGRGQETYGEDPFLTGRLGVSLRQRPAGRRSHYFKTIATPKHYAVHSGPESTRHSVNIDPHAHDLWDTYLPAFRATIVDAKADSIMCAYNAVDNTPPAPTRCSSANILRGDWNFSGFVTSDCGAIDRLLSKQGPPHLAPTRTHAAADGILAGTDTNCGKDLLSP